MGPGIVGWLLIVIGFIALLAGIGGGIATMGRQLQRERDQALALPDFPTELIKALTEFIKALGVAPVWLALTILGIVLIAWGGTMI